MQDATRIIRCWTALAKLSGAQLLIELWPVMLQIARLVSGLRREEPSPEATFRFETNLQDLLREMGRVIVQWTFNHLEPEDILSRKMPSLLRYDGKYYRRRKKSPMRNLNCLFGPIALRRFYYEPLECCGRGLFPLEIQLGIVTSVATGAWADTVAGLDADLTQRQPADRRRRHAVLVVPGGGAGGSREACAELCDVSTVPVLG